LREELPHHLLHVVPNQVHIPLEMEVADADGTNPGGRQATPHGELQDAVDDLLKLPTLAPLEPLEQEGADDLRR
jgi:hypothetical protein